jgi:hypothetical protein
MTKVHPHAILTARDLRRIGAPTHDRRDPNRVATRTAGFGREDHAIADAEAGVCGESVVDRDGALDRAPRWNRIDPLRTQRIGRGRYGGQQARPPEQAQPACVS